MQPYQEEYIANLKDIAVLTARKSPEDRSFEAYQEAFLNDRKQAEEKAKRNMTLLKEELFPVLDRLFEAKEEEIRELREFAGKLTSVGEELDVGLFCQIHQALLSLARHRKNRKDIIQELYWLGIGRNSLCNKMVGLDSQDSEKYVYKMRLCFTEAAAYLKYFDDIEDTETRGYIMRSRANMALGKFKSVSERVRILKQTLQIMQDKGYQEKEPDLPWEKYIYMTHQLMAASISYSRENTMTSQDIADIMESVYIVYHKRMQEAAEQKERPPIKSAFAYYAITYFCGLDTLEGLLTKMEALIDAADTSDYSGESMYGIISIPAFYCQFMQQYPEKIPERKEYIEGLYRRILLYVEDSPKASENATLFFYLRQLSATFVETEDSISYGEFIQKLQKRFAPDIYVHSHAVGRAAAVLCGIILEEDVSFFDDIDFIRRITDLQEKKDAILTYAMECGVFHDVGKMNFMSLYSQTGRQWFEEEYEMARLHTMVGEACLALRSSTSRFADIAKGHHSWYDGTHGYPESYKRLECSYRQMVDVIGLVDWLDNVTETGRFYTGFRKSFREAADEAVSLEGKRFSPLLTARLRDRKVAEQIEQAFEEGRREACHGLYKNFQI